MIQPAASIKVPICELGGRFQDGPVAGRNLLRAWPGAAILAPLFASRDVPATE